jgi:hypothetical protein
VSCPASSGYDYFIFILCCVLPSVRAVVVVLLPLPGAVLSSLSGLNTVSVPGGELEQLGDTLCGLMHVRLLLVSASSSI